MAARIFQNLSVFPVIGGRLPNWIRCPAARRPKAVQVQATPGNGSDHLSQTLEEVDIRPYRYLSFRHDMDVPRPLPEIGTIVR
jgi:hypothetical protein